MNNKKRIEKDQVSKTGLYEDRFVLRPLKCLIVIVNEHQGDFFVNSFKDVGVSCSFSSYGKGTASSDIRHILGVEDKKDLVLSLVKESDVGSCLDICRERFKVSQEAKGIAFTIKVDSVVGVMLYRFLTDTKQNRRK